MPPVPLNAIRRTIHIGLVQAWMYGRHGDRIDLDTLPLAEALPEAAAAVDTLTRLVMDKLKPHLTATPAGPKTERV